MLANIGAVNLASQTTVNLGQAGKNCTGVKESAADVITTGSKKLLDLKLMRTKAMVHHVRGRFNDAYYQNPSVGSWIVWNEIEEQFDTSRNIYLLVLDISSEYLDGTGDDTGGLAGLGSGDSLSGRVLVTASDTDIALHELGHAFGLSMLSDAKLYSGYGPR